MNILEKMISDEGGVYGMALEKSSNKVLYITPAMKENPYIKVKEGDILPKKAGLFGDGSEDIRSLMFDSYAKEAWFYAYTVNKTLEDGTQVVLKYAVPTEMPLNESFVLRTEKL